ncbi:endolytic transglycosylase MltG [Rhodococcoides kroppenstedtii]|uniref:endolytic transglycosylase MltG n=1 Tax=Rhodococcoides kroppenstedtii TaxID=293050 RepID=UPI0036392BC7
MNDEWDTDRIPVVRDGRARDGRARDGAREGRPRPVGDRGAPAPDAGRAGARRRRAAEGRKRRARIVGGLAVIALVVLVGAAGVWAFSAFRGGPEPAADFAGPGGATVVVAVQPGDTAEQIAGEMADKGVTASSAAFYEAALQNSAITAVQPGYYRLQEGLPAADAVATLVDPAARVGQIQIAEGRQLHDTTDVNTGAVRKGIYTLISEASCAVGEGVPCVTYQQLDEAGAGDPAELGVADWARDAVSRVPDRDRQLEGLIAAGTWNVDPSASPAEMIRQLVTESAELYESTGLLETGANSGLDPYQVLVAASLIERESLPQDFAKVARVILNRLAIGQKLEFDSTVNYALDTTEVATTDVDRGTVTPWNTYASEGLPATPICSPGVGAVQAAENPEPGNWLYFVTINAQGETLFTDNYQTHLDNIQKVEGGFLDSGR